MRAASGRFPVRKTAAGLLLECEAFNRACPIGSKVSVTNDFGVVIETVTEGPACVLEGHSAVILVKDISGCYALERVKPGWSADDAEERRLKEVAS